MIQFIQPSGSTALAPKWPQLAALAGLPPIHQTPRTYTRRFPRRGLGAGSQGGQAAGGVITSIAPATGPAAPFVAAAGLLVSAISSFLGGGCGQACIQSAQAEQIYEVALQDLWAVAKMGMLSQAEYEAAAQALVQGGQQHLTALQGQNPKGADALKNFTKAESGQVSQGSSLPATAPKPLDVSQAQAAFIQPGAGGWYAESVAAGNQLAAQYLQALQSQNSSFGISSAGVTVLGTTFSMGTALLILAAVVGIYFYSRG